MLEVTKNKIKLTRGDTGIFNVHVKDADNEDYELQEGDVLRFTLRKTPKSGDVFIQKVVTGAEIVISPEDTQKMTFGTYYYDLELTKSDGTVDTIIPPMTFELLEEVTY